MRRDASPGRRAGRRPAGRAAASKTTTAGEDATKAAAGNSMIVASEPS